MRWILDCCGCDDAVVCDRFCVVEIMIGNAEFVLARLKRSTQPNFSDLFYSNNASLIIAPLHTHCLPRPAGGKVLRCGGKL